MNNQPDPVFAGLAEGLKPAARDDGPTLSVTELAAISIDNRFTRIADALERIEENSEREARAAERTADAMETLMALFASVIGAANSKCGYGTDERTDVVNFIRSGRGLKDFPCDEDIRAYAAEENESN